MGPADDPIALLDEELGVHGIANLHVSDASVTPNMVRPDTDITTTVIGERAADLLRGLS